MTSHMGGSQSDQIRSARVDGGRQELEQIWRLGSWHFWTQYQFGKARVWRTVFRLDVM